MARQISIQIFNKSPTQKFCYLRFQSQNQNSETEGILQPYFMKQAVNAGGELVFKFMDNIYAVAGLIKATPGAHASIAQWDYSKEPVTFAGSDSFGSNFHVTMDKDKEIITIGNDVRNSGLEGTFLMSMYNFPVQDKDDLKYYFGLGMENYRGDIITLSVTSINSAKYHRFEPPRKMYVCMDSKEKVDFRTSTGNEIEIDFSNLDRTGATITYWPDGKYTFSNMHKNLSHPRTVLPERESISD